MLKVPKFSTYEKFIHEIFKWCSHCFWFWISVSTAKMLFCKTRCYLNWTRLTPKWLFIRCFEFLTRFFFADRLRSHVFDRIKGHSEAITLMRFFHQFRYSFPHHLVNFWKSHKKQTGDVRSIWYWSGSFLFFIIASQRIMKKRENLWFYCYWNRQQGQSYQYF